MTRRLVVAAFVVAFARMAGAQPVLDAAPSRADETVVADGSFFDRAFDVHARLDLHALADWMKQRPVTGGSGVRRWLDPASFRISSARFAARTAIGLPAPGRKINRTFLPVPIVGWQRYSSLLTPRGYFSLYPSIVVGRRMSWAPELARGGRTFGVAVQMRIWFDRPAGKASEPATIRLKPDPTGEAGPATIRLKPDPADEARPKPDPAGTRSRIRSVVHAILAGNMR